MAPTPYRVYVVFKHTSIEGKYIPLLYTASDVAGASLVLPSDSTIYTIPTGNGSEEKAEYRLAEVVVIGTFTDTNYIQVWFNDQPTEHIIVNAINTRETVTRQFKTIDLFVKEGTSIKFKLAA